MVVSQDYAARTEEVPNPTARKNNLELAFKVKGHLVNKIQHQDGEGMPLESDSPGDK